MDEVTGFASLFRGSQAGYGTEEGGCDKDTSVSYYERIIMHLEGDRPMGVYPLVCDHQSDMDESPWIVRWGCVDFDEGEEISLAHALNVRAVIAQMGGTAFVERSRSKGYHVWLFLDGWYPAVLVREALLGACQVVDAPTREINPKSVSLAEGQLGNYVRLPYPGGLSEEAGFPNNRRVVINPNRPVFHYTCEQFVAQALESRCGRDVLDSLRSLYEPPKRIVPVMPPVDVAGDVYKRMDGLSWTIYEKGPLDGSGRGHTLYKMACLLAEGGKHTAGEVLQLCIEADMRWGKFHYRPNGEATIEKMVSKAFNY